MKRYNKTGGIVYDACTVAALIDPSVVELQPMHVDVELGGTYTRGRTVADTRGRKEMPVNVDVGVNIDREKFLKILYESVK